MKIGTIDFNKKVVSKWSFSQFQKTYGHRLRDVEGAFLQLGGKISKKKDPQDGDNVRKA